MQALRLKKSKKKINTGFIGRIFATILVTVRNAVERRGLEKEINKAHNVRFKRDLLSQVKPRSVKIDNSSNFPLSGCTGAARLQYIKQLSYVGMGW